jgi:exodeoxyribonuclease V beta subunit
MAPEGLDDSDKAISGMLKGIIDLIFEHDGKYYIADWKTNILDGEPPAFDIDPARPLESRIAAEIAHSLYSLQWAIYAVALHRHLRNSLPGYDYAAHFGGVRYCFVRGMSPAHPGAGVWVQTPPPPEAMAALDGFFGAPRDRAASAT